MFCQNKYDVPRGEMIDVNSMFVCGLSGKWKPSASVPDCASLYFHFFCFENVIIHSFFYNMMKHIEIDNTMAFTLIDLFVGGLQSHYQHFLSIHGGHLVMFWF